MEVPEGYAPDELAYDLSYTIAFADGETVTKEYNFMVPRAPDSGGFSLWPVSNSQARGLRSIQTTGNLGDYVMEPIVENIQGVEFTFSGFIGNGSRAVYNVRVPEPSTVVLLWLGVPTLGMARLGRHVMTRAQEERGPWK